jgi:hypothetical protein
MNLDKYFDKINKILETRNASPLTDVEKQLLTANWQQACLQWQHSPSLSTSEYAQDKQLEWSLSNKTFDVLKHTRNYGSK